MADETIGIDVKLQLGDLQKQLAQIPGMTAEQAKLMVAELNKSVKASEKAARDAAKAAGAGTKKIADDAKKAAEDFSKTAGGMGGNIQKLAGFLDSVIPGAGRFAQSLADVGDVGEVAGDVAKGLGTSISGLAATFGPLVVVVGALSAAYVVQSREVDRLVAARQFEHDITKSLTASERALQDAKLAEAVATGDLTEAEGAETRARRSAQRAVLDYYEAQKKTREELQKSIDDSKKYVTVQRGLAVALAAVAAYGTGQGEVAFKRYALAIDQAFDSVTGLESGVSDAKGKLGELDQAVQTQAKNQGELKDATLATDRATRAKSEGDKAATEALKALTAAYEASKRAMDEDSAIQAQFAAGLAGIQSAGEKAAESQLDGEARLSAARDLALKQLLEQYQATLQLAGADADRLKASGAYEASKAAIVQASEAEIASLRKSAEDKAKKERDDALKRRMDDERKSRDEYVAIIQDGLSKGADLTAQASAKNADVASSLQAQLIAGEGIYTKAQEAALKKRIASAKEAALRQFEISKGLSIGSAVMNTAEGVSKALAGPFPLVRSAIIAAEGAAQVAVISAQQPTFHAGGVFDPSLGPDEGYAKLRKGEPVLAPVARSVLGDDTLRKASAGVSSPSGSIYTVQVYGHNQIVDRWERDRLRVGGPLSMAVKKNSKPGMGGL